MSAWTDFKSSLCLCCRSASRLTESSSLTPVSPRSGRTACRKRSSTTPNIKQTNISLTHIEQISQWSWIKRVSCARWCTLWAMKASKAHTFRTPVRVPTCQQNVGISLQHLHVRPTAASLKPGWWATFGGKKRKEMFYLMMYSTNKEMK